MIHAERNRQLVRRGVQRLASHAQVVEIVLVVSGACVEEYAVTLRAGERQPASNLPEEGACHRRLGLNESEVAVVELDFGSGCEAWLTRGDDDRARGGVLAEECSLRSAQHFDLFDVEEIERRGCGARVEDAVDVETDARLDAVVGQAEWCPQTADVDRRVARIGRVELNGRQHLLQAIHVEGTRVRDQIASHDRHGNRHFLRDLFDPTRGDNDRLAESRRTQRHFTRGRLALREHDAIHGGLEAVEHGFDAVTAWRERRDAIRTLAVSDLLDDGVGVLVDDLDARAGYRTTRRVPHDTGNRTRRGLRR